jgi:DNA modification methylase
VTLRVGCVHHGDCLERLREVEPGSVDMVFADLPYGVTANKWDRTIDLSRLWPLLRRAAKPTAAMVFTAVQPYASELVVSNREEFRFDIVWKKNVATGFLNARRRPLRAHECVLVFWRKHPVYYPQKTTGHARVRVTPSKHVEAPKSANYGGREPGSLLKTKVYESTERYPTTVLAIDGVEQHDKNRKNPTQKPEGLVAWFVRTYTDPGDLVLDPTAGSGSTLCAAMALGRFAVGFELDPEQVAGANGAIEQRFPQDFSSWRGLA